MVVLNHLLRINGNIVSCILIEKVFLLEKLEKAVSQNISFVVWKGRNMKIVIMYDSKTGNTKLIAKAIKDATVNHEVICLDSKQEIIDADLYFIGSWTDKGNCSGMIADICKQLHNKKVVLFGTCGFGGAGEYQESLYQRFVVHVPKDNTVLGYFYCMGKMPLATRERYVSMLQAHPDDAKLAVSIENFDEALKHPNQKDIENVQEFTKEMLAKC